MNSVVDGENRPMAKKIVPTTAKSIANQPKKPPPKISCQAL